MVTKESLIQEVKDICRTVGRYCSFDYTLFEDEDLLKLHLDFFPWQVKDSLLRYVRSFEPNRYYYEDVTIGEILDKIVDKCNEPKPARCCDDVINIYPYSEVLLPNVDISERTTIAYTHRETETEVIDQHTGEVIPADVPMVRYRDGFMMVSNLDRNFYICISCGELLYSLDVDYEGEYYRLCEDCYETDGYWEICDRCNEPFRNGDMVEVHTRYGDELWCDDCAECHAWRCDCCEEWYDDESNSTETINGSYVCDDCLSDYYYRCQGCGEYVHEEDVYFDEDDNAFCERCYHNRDEIEISDFGFRHIPSDDEEPFERVINNYHYHHNNSNETFGEDDRRQGIELEVEGSGKSIRELNLMAKQLIEMSTDEDGYSHIYCENDGSLRNGFEIITNPHTPEELLKLPLKEMLQTLIDNGYTSHNNGRCGLHIHFSNEWFGDDYDEIDDNVAKVVHFYSENYETMFKLSRRTTGSAESWARRFKVDDFEESKCMKGCSTGHGTAVNLGNMNTIHTVEFRLGRGTLLYNSFMAWLDIHLAIVRNVRNIAKNDTDINKWFAGVSEETKEYIKNKTGIEIVDAEREVA